VNKIKLLICYSFNSDLNFLAVRKPKRKIHRGYEQNLFFISGTKTIQYYIIYQSNSSNYILYLIHLYIYIFIYSEIKYYIYYITSARPVQH